MVVGLNKSSTGSPVDPLGEVTRKERRNLLAASLFGIVFNAFNIRVGELEAGGSKFKIDPEALPFLVVACGAYFLVTFCLYYYHDIKNWEWPEHLKISKDLSKQKPTKWRDTEITNHAYWAATFFSEENINIKYMISSPFTSFYSKYVAGNASNGIKIDEHFSFEAVGGMGMMRDRVIQVEHDMVTHFTNWFAEFRVRHEFYKIYSAIPYWFVATSYFFRNVVWELLLPCALAVYAGLVLFGHADAGWVKDFVHLPTNVPRP